MTLELGMITVDCAAPKALADFWTAALGVEVEQDYGEFLFLGPVPGGEGVRLGFQHVSRPTPGKNRLHLDLRTADLPAEVARLVELGARTVAEHAVPGLIWTVLADPAGNEFCVGSHQD
jgi:catechol 2,3-dioxygenase-like lactoylglutathione lyase family enzyme